MSSTAPTGSTTTDISYTGGLKVGSKAISTDIEKIIIAMLGRSDQESLSKTDRHLKKVTFSVVKAKAVKDFETFQKKLINILEPDKPKHQFAIEECNKIIGIVKSLLESATSFSGIDKVFLERGNSVRNFSTHDFGQRFELYTNIASYYLGNGELPLMLEWLKKWDKSSLLQTCKHDFLIKAVKYLSVQANLSGIKEVFDYCIKEGIDFTKIMDRTDNPQFLEALLRYAEAISKEEMQKTPQNFRNAVASAKRSCSLARPGGAPPLISTESDTYHLKPDGSIYMTRGDSDFITR
jgi:hypothetical protein